jgi:hypothetical protein
MVERSVVEDTHCIDYCIRHVRLENLRVRHDHDRGRRFLSVVACHCCLEPDINFECDHRARDEVQTVLPQFWDESFDFQVAAIHVELDQYPEMTLLAIIYDSYILVWCDLAYRIDIVQVLFCQTFLPQVTFHVFELRAPVLPEFDLEHSDETACVCMELSELEEYY